LAEHPQRRPLLKLLALNSDHIITPSASKASMTVQNNAEIDEAEQRKLKHTLLENCADTVSTWKVKA
jgi:hypothetical protein